MRIIVNGTLVILISRIGHRILPRFMFNVLTDKPIWVQALTTLFVLDFIFYVTHRLKHRWRWWWRLHETHHSSAEMDFLSSVRFHPLEKLLDRLLYLFPLFFLGISETAVFIWSGVDVFLGMLNHSNLNWRIGPLIYIFVGPEMHRWHHVKDPRMRECNYGNNFSIFDWIFGTAYLSYEKPRHYGVEDRNYPQDNIVKQFFYAFRPFSEKTQGIKQDFLLHVEAETSMASIS
jgi:sterol desaturase/sphingolipid hydroxylase (fatty acid hydroxylase superfamily)